MTRSRVTLAAGLALGLFAAVLFVRADAPKPDDKPARVDASGDPLPQGAVGRLGTLRWRHSTAILHVAYISDGKEILTVSQDGLMRVWEADTGREMRRFVKVGNAVPNVRFGLKIQMAADVMVVPDGSSVTSVGLSPDGKTAVVTGQYGSFTLWDVTTGKEINTIKMPRGFRSNLLVFAPDGKSFFVTSYKQYIHQYDVAEGKEVRRFFEAPDPRNSLVLLDTPGSLAVSADGKTLMAGALESENRQPVIKSWGIETGKQQPVRNGPQGQITFNSLTIAADGKKAAWSQHAGRIHVWDLAADKEVSRLNGPQNSAPHAMSFSPDGKTLAVRLGSDQTIRLWNVAEGKERLTLGEGARIHLGKMANPLAFSPDGKRLALGTATQTVRQFDTAFGKEIAIEKPGHHGPVNQITFSPDDKTVVTRAHNALHLWDVAAGKEIKRHSLPAGTIHVAFTADARVAVFGNGNGTVTTWDVAEGKERKSWKGAAGLDQSIQALALSPDGKTVAVRGPDQSIRLWEAGTGRELTPLAEAPADAALTLAQLQGGTFAYRPMTQALAFSPDGTLLAGITEDVVASAEGNARRAVPYSGTLRLWDASTGKHVRKLESPPVNVGIAAFAFAPDGRTIAGANSDNTIVLWESASGKERSILTFGKPAGAREKATPLYGPSPLSCIVFSADGRVVAVGGPDGTVRACDTLTGLERAAFKGHQAGVVCLAITADGKFIASGSKDMTALVWEVPASGDQPKAMELEPSQAETLWADLADGDATKAYQAVRVLSQVPKRAVPLLKDKVEAVPPPDARKLADMIADLDSNAFASRKKAEDELEKMGELAEDALRKALDAKPALEVQKRIESLLSKLATGGAVSAHQLRTYRALEVLEAIGTPEAQEVLKTIAKGAPGARITKDAQGALNRLGKR